MPRTKQPLCDRLAGMADDIQIGGDTCFRAMAKVVVLCEPSACLPEEVRREMERLLRRADGLLRDLNNFWHRYPDMGELVDLGDIAAS